MNPWIMIVIGFLIVVAVGLGVLARKRQGSSQTNSSLTFVLVALALVIGGGALIYYFVPKGTTPDPEIEMGLMVVTAIAALMTLLFVLAAGFSSMNLTDPKQPLGLPEGSIRAMIALVLIMVFIIFGIYLFRSVGGGYSTPIQKGLSADDLTKLDMSKYSGIAPTYIEPDPKESGKYILSLQTKASDDGARLAQQLLTTVGTLVVAVAGFYFGSTTVSSAVAAAQSTTTSTPLIKDISPREGPKGKLVDFEITGTDFKSPKAVRLVRGSDSMVATDFLANASRIQGKIMIDRDPDGKWDVIVENEDGRQARLPEAFTIK